MSLHDTEKVAAGLNGCRFWSASVKLWLPLKVNSVDDYPLLMPFVLPFVNEDQSLYIPYDLFACFFFAVVIRIASDLSAR